MRLGISVGIILALLSVPASAHQRHHHYRHYAHHQLNPVVEGLGMGLAVMLRRAQESQGAGWPNVADIPPNGWPFQPYQNPVKRAWGAVADLGHRITHFRDGRPRAWCGWFMRQERGVADTSYNLARNWAHWGHPAGGPRVGAVVVWPHHVGEIAPGECPSGEWMVHSGNDGHAVRTRCRSLRGAIAFRD